MILLSNCRVLIKLNGNEMNEEQQWQPTATTTANVEQCWMVEMS